MSTYIDEDINLRFLYAVWHCVSFRQFLAIQTRSRRRFFYPRVFPAPSSHCCRLPPIPLGQYPTKQALLETPRSAISVIVTIQTTAKEISRNHPWAMCRLDRHFLPLSTPTSIPLAVIAHLRLARHPANLIPKGWRKCLKSKAHLGASPLRDFAGAPVRDPICVCASID